jgi:arginase family enzyme
VPNDAVPPSAAVVVVGVPVDRYSALKGVSEAPLRMRALPHYDVHGTFDLTTVEGVDIGDIDPWRDDLDEAVEEAVEHTLDYTDALLVVIGGDDAISLPVVNTVGGQVVHLDAHTDQWTYPQRRHGSWVGEVDFPVHQIGTRVGPNVRREPLVVGAVTTLVVDIDVADPACAPGVSYPVPGGMTSSELLNVVEATMRTYSVRAVVVTEVNPSRDHNDITSWLAQFVIVKAIEGHHAKLSMKPGKTSS